MIAPAATVLPAIFLMRSTTILKFVAISPVNVRPPSSSPIYLL